ncbi:MAG: hypothetical protein ABGW76_13060 [Mesonia sp.]|uniref:hypothetical protein n=1 Tax=Mesonia sp. TaxID=1960830 RepID=UPI003241DB76
MKNFLLLSLLVFSSLSAFSQNAEYNIGYFYEGYIITNDGEEKRGFIQYLDESDRYEKVLFKAEKRGKKEKFKPKDIKAYHVADVTYHAVKYEDIPFKNEKFLILEKEGCLNQYYYRKYNNEDRAWETEVILKNDEKAISTQKFIMGFASKMAEMVKSNEELAQKVRNKEKGYGLFKLEAIVDEFNANCNE